LRETQQVIVNVVSLDRTGANVTGNGTSSEVPPWGNIYEGLSDAEVDRLDAAIRQRANLTREIG
jgi:hypothetical protein